MKVPRYCPDRSNRGVNCNFACSGSEYCLGADYEGEPCQLRRKCWLFNNTLTKLEKESN